MRWKWEKAKAHLPNFIYSAKIIPVIYTSFFLRREFLTNFNSRHYHFLENIGYFWHLLFSLKNHMLSWSLNNNITSLVTLICFLTLKFHEVQTFFVLIFSFPFRGFVENFVVSSLEPWFLAGQSSQLSCREQPWELPWLVQIFILWDSLVQDRSICLDKCPVPRIAYSTLAWRGPRYLSDLAPSTLLFAHSTAATFGSSLVLKRDRHMLPSGSLHHSSSTRNHLPPDLHVVHSPAPSKSVLRPSFLLRSTLTTPFLIALHL